MNVDIQGAFRGKQHAWKMGGHSFRPLVVRGVCFLVVKGGRPVQPTPQIYATTPLRWRQWVAFHLPCRLDQDHYLLHCRGKVGLPGVRIAAFDTASAAPAAK